MLSMQPLKMANQIENDMGLRKCDESEFLSKIDDLEIDRYLHNEEERQYKKIIWEKLNWDYLEDQAAKEEAAQKGFDASASVAKSQKGKKKRQTQVAKGPGSVQLDPEATQASRKKRLSSKVNFETVEKLFGESDPLAALENSKKALFEKACKNRGDDEPEARGELEEGTDEMGELYENTCYDNNVDEGYEYEDDDYNLRVA